MLRCQVVACAFTQDGLNTGTNGTARPAGVVTAASTGVMYFTHILPATNQVNASVYYR